MLDTRSHDTVFNARKFNLLNYKVLVIGAGAIGSSVSIQLAKLGIQNIYVHDFDVIEPHNICNQIGYRSHDTGQGKAYVTANVLREINPDGMFTGEPLKHGQTGCQKLKGHDYIFCCVDSMEARKNIFEKQVHYNLDTVGYFEARMHIKGCQALGFDPQSRKAVNEYKEQLYADSEVKPNIGSCGHTQSVIATAQIAASVLVWLFIQHVNEKVSANEVLIDCENWNMISRKFGE